MILVDVIVVMVADPGLRSALVGRLTMQGENVLTLSRVMEGPELVRLAGRDAILIADRALIDRRDVDYGWFRVIAIGEASSDLGDAVIFVPRDATAARVPALLAEWRATPRE